jgi:hypothetical protein
VASRVLSSKWGKLNPGLLATLYPVNRQGYAEPDAAGDMVSVQAPPVEGSLELTGNWQSAFEQSGAEAKAPTIMAMLQTGQLQSYVEVLLGKGNDETMTGRISLALTEISQSGAGRTGMTKLNSTQIFTGSAPVKISMTLAFRAFDDPASEVTQPVDQLCRWVLAKELAMNSSLAQGIQNFRDGQGVLKWLLPSVAPQLLALRFAGYTFSPMVLESVSRDLTGPRSAQGSSINSSVQITLASLTALDQGDWIRARQGEPARMFNNT